MVSRAVAVRCKFHLTTGNLLRRLFRVEQLNYETSNGLRSAREARGMNQETLAQIIGVTDGAVSHWETGRATPGAPARKLLALVLGESEAVIDSWFSKVEAVA